ncbi:adenylate/guanylate cyclase domain-containing protein [Flavobacterium frigoris]|uniref:Adenylate cyclase n=1 Tax=Flavobacterium frigoris (strain PS1) TaxID=1086011 RepID=H7FU38_FLAFP|nr:adenylate/guanylate cyclase domain-containing protein [Flavobacterium frigoris]EIA07890.1 adenylate cyclase [Flavobacterium frigoris PS1]
MEPSLFKYYFKASLFFLSFHLSMFAQEQKVADSLVEIYRQGNLGNIEKLELLRNLSFNEVNDLNLSLRYAEELIRLSKLENNYLYLHRGYFQKGTKLRITGDLQRSLDAFFKSEQAATKAKYIAGQGIAFSSIADVYSVMGNSKNAGEYYDKAIRLLRKTTNTIGLASALLNAGDEYLKDKKYDLALAYFEESGVLFKQADYLIGSAYNLGNIGMVYAEQGKNDLAESYITEAIKILEDLKDYYAISDYLTYMSDIYLKKNEWAIAVNYAQRSLLLAQKYGLKEQISSSNLKLSELYQNSGNASESLKYYKDHIAYRDSVTNLKSVQQMADLRTNFEVSKKQSEVDLLNQGKKNRQILATSSLISLLLVFLLALGMYRRYKFIKKTNVIIEEEKNRSDSLLLNILPVETAFELKKNGKVLAKKFESVTVLFTDFESFTHYAEKLSPEKLVEIVDYYFSKFDAIIEKYNLEKIKTVGDCYMCAGGLPFPTKDHAYRMVLAAFEMVEFVRDSKNNNPLNHTRFEIRIGINSGPVVAGVVGTKKFAYDIWGDSVNIASRMESNSESGKINISENTYELIKDAFDCDYRGEIEVKNRGMMKMYFINDSKHKMI